MRYKLPQIVSAIKLERTILSSPIAEIWQQVLKFVQSVFLSILQLDATQNQNPRKLGFQGASDSLNN